jgi:hypothetical protein
VTAPKQIIAFCYFTFQILPLFAPEMSNIFTFYSAHLAKPRQNLAMMTILLNEVIANGLVMSELTFLA